MRWARAVTTTPRFSRRRVRGPRRSSRQRSKLGSARGPTPGSQSRKKETLFVLADFVDDQGQELDVTRHDGSRYNHMINADVIEQLGEIHAEQFEQFDALDLHRASLALADVPAEMRSYARSTLLEALD